MFIIVKILLTLTIVVQICNRNKYIKHFITYRDRKINAYLSYVTIYYKNHNTWGCRQWKILKLGASLCFSILREKCSCEKRHNFSFFLSFSSCFCINDFLFFSLSLHSLAHSVCLSLSITPVPLLKDHFLSSSFFSVCLFIYWHLPLPIISLSISPFLPPTFFLSLSPFHPTSSKGQIPCSIQIFSFAE